MTAGATPSATAARRLAVTTTGLLAAFVAFELHAMAVYPGGSWRDPGSVGHRLWENFFCDLSADITVSGLPHPGAWCGKLAMLLFAAALLPFWRLGSWLGSNPRLVRATWQSGCVSSLAGACVPWVTGNPGHSIVSLLAGGSGMLATAGVLWFAWRQRCTWIWASGLLALLATGSVAVIYLAVILFGVTPLLLPGAQKIACLCLMVWMLATVWLPSSSPAHENLQHRSKAQ